MKIASTFLHPKYGGLYEKPHHIGRSSKVAYGGVNGVFESEYCIDRQQRLPKAIYYKSLINIDYLAKAASFHMCHVLANDATTQTLTQRITP